MGLLDGKVAIVTGSGGGLGRSHALGLAAEGALVVVNDPGVSLDGSDSSQKMADQVVEEITKAGGKAVANYDSVATSEGAAAIVKTAIDTYGKVDILINNAGILRDKTLLKMDESMWDPVIDVHLKGSFLLTKMVGEKFRDQGTGGSIVNTSSYAGLKGNFGQANYGAAKAGIYGLTLVTALEFKKLGVNANCIAPMAKTRMTENIPVIPESMLPEHITPMVLFLVSEKARDVTGRIFGVHGGHIFEYKMNMTDGIKRDEGFWTPVEIADKMDEIGAEAAPADEGEENEAAQELDTIFENIHLGFVPENAGDWKANLHFKVARAGNYTIEIDENKCRSKKGLHGEATCVVDVDVDTLVGMFTGKIKGEQAFMEGRIKATNIQDMIKFGQTFQSPDAKGVDSKGSPDTSDGLNKEYLGKLFRGPALFARPEHIKAYAEATNDDNPLYQEGDRPLAPPIFNVRLCNDLMFDILKDPDLKCDLLHLVHGEQDMRFYRPTKAWDLVSPRGTITKIEDKSSGQILTLQFDFYCEGNVICTAAASMFIKNAKKKKEKTEEATEGEEKKAKRPSWTPPEGEPTFSLDIDVTDDQPIRYGYASLDTNPIHMDDEVAKSAGLPGKILQGLCTMAFVSQGVVKKVADGNSRRLERLKVRFARPVLPGDKITVEGTRREEENGVEVYDVWAKNQNGDFVITQGEAEVSKAG